MRYASFAMVCRRLAQPLLIGLALACVGTSRPASAEALHQCNATELRLQVDGGLLGQVVWYDENMELVPAQVRVTFAKGQDVVATARTDAEGLFRVTGLAPGSYAVFTTGPKGFGAFGLRVLPGDVPVIGGAAMQNDQPVAGSENMTFSPVPAASYRLFASLVHEDMRRGTTVQEGSGTAGSVAGASKPGAVVQTNMAARATVNADHDVTHTHLRVDGNLVGRVMNVNNGEVVPELTQVSFVQNGQILASVRTDEWGYFQVVGLKPGIYSVMTVSARGFSALAIQVLPFENKEGGQQQTLLHLSGGAKVHFVSSGSAMLNVIGFSTASSNDYETFDTYAQGAFGGTGAGLTGTGVVAGEAPAAMGMAGGAAGAGGGLGAALGAAALGIGVGLGGGSDSSGTAGGTSTADSP